LAALEEYAVEASILKVAGSELTDFVVDENVQIHGGNGFVHDYPAEGHYRDARVNRIFEGTNEINRLLIPGMLIKRALKGGLPLFDKAKAIQDSLLAGPSGGVGEQHGGVREQTGGVGEHAALRADARVGEFVARTAPQVRGMKDVSIALLGLAMQTFRADVENEQEVLTLVADIVMDTFAAESAWLRASAHPENALHQTAAELVVHSAAMRVEMNAREALPAIVSGDTLKIMQSALKRLLKVPAMNTVAARRTLSDAAAEKNAYPF
jgi:hypothetical protein